ncbi:hypothetical protein [Serratia sp. N21D137]|uniref:hypothetical protein n=1 Tax=Serratia sp. N21D137 TaxID=3397495 RepID=UPI0039E17939
MSDEYFKLRADGLPTRREWEEQVIEAARKFVNCKGRYHSEQNMTALIELFRQEPEKP